MIVLMLNRSREKSARLDLKHLTFQRLRAHEHRLGAFNVTGDFGKAQATFHSYFGFTAQLDFRVDQHDRHRAFRINILATALQGAWPVFDGRNVEYGELQRLTDLLRCQTHSVCRMHRLDHAHRQVLDSLIDFLDPFTFGPQDWVAILQDRQDHGPSSRVNAGKFFTPASFSASITLMIVPNDAFLSACNASVDLRSSGNPRTAASSSSTFTTRPSSLTSSFWSMLTIA